MCKGPYVILQGGSPIEKASNLSFDFNFLEPRVFTKGRYKRLIFSKEKDSSHFIQIREKDFFSLLLREKFSRASYFGSDKGAHTSSTDQT